MLPLFAGMLTLGAVLQQQFHISPLATALFASIGAGFFLVRIRSKKAIVLALSMVVACVLGSVLMLYAKRPIPRAVFGERVFQATVTAVDRRLSQDIIRVRDDTYHVQLQLNTSNDTFLPGDKVSVHAVITAPTSFETNTGRLFEYQQYLASKHIAGIGKQATVSLVEKGRLSFSRAATIIRFRIADNFTRYIAFPIDGVIAGMVVGYQGGIPAYIQDLFRNTGVLHVLVLSGYNITMLAGFISLILRWMPTRIRAVCSMTAISVLVLISGSGVASVRAGIMGCLPLFATMGLYKFRKLQLLIIAYLFFFSTSPLAIVYDPGLHLSFLATSFMLLLLPKVMPWFQWIPATKGINIRELVVLAFVLPIFMLPYTMYFSGSFPTASPIANILMALVTPLFSLIALIVLLFSWMPLLAPIFGALLSAGGSIVLQLLQAAGTFPQWNTPTISWWVVTGIYAVLFLVFLKREVHRHFWRLRSYLQQTSSSSEKENHARSSSCQTGNNQ